MNEAIDTEPEVIVKHGNKLFTPFENDVVKAYKPYEPEKPEYPEIEPHYEWLGSKIPIDTFKQMISYCLWSQKEFKSEAVMILMYNIDTRDWQVWAPPQETAGMTVKTLPDHEDWDEQRAFFRGYSMLGTLHHHCTSSAYQSGTDHSDEMSKEGVHFTLGNLDKDELSVHTRAIFKGVEYKCELTDWLERPDYLDDLVLPPELKNGYVNKAVIKSVESNLLRFKEMDFHPEWWNANLKKKVYTPKTTIYNKTSSWQDWKTSTPTIESPDLIDSPEGQAILQFLAPQLNSFRQKYFRGKNNIEYFDLIEDILSIDSTDDFMKIHSEHGHLQLTMILFQYKRLFEECGVHQIDWMDFIRES